MQEVNNMQKNNQTSFQTSKNQFLTQFSINSKSANKKINFVQQKKANEGKNQRSKWKKSINNKNQKKFVQIYQPPKPQIQKQFQQLRRASLQKKIFPGPGQYNIAVPIVKPNYQTLQKNQEIVLIKINNNGGTANFKTNQNRFDYIYNQQNMLTPGPGEYQTINSQKKLNKKQHPYYHINYDSIRQFYLQNYQKVDSIPNITIQKTSQNSHYIGKPRRLQQLQVQLKQKYNQKQINQRLKLLKNAKKLNSSLKSLWNNQNTKNLSPNLKQQKAIFPISNNQEAILNNQQTQIYEKRQMMQTLYRVNKNIEYEKMNQLKLRKILGTNQHKIKEKQLNTKMSCYYDNNPIDKQNYEKYNVKLDFKKQKLKKILTKQKKYSTLQVQSNLSKSKQYLTERKQIKNGINSISLNLRQQLQKYNRNMLDILSIKKKSIINEQISQKKLNLLRSYIDNQMNLDQIIIEGKKKLDQSQAYKNQRYSSIQ